VANGGANAVCAGVAAADDHHILTGSGDVVVAHLAVQHRPGVLRQELHGKVDALQLTPLNGQVRGRVEPVQSTTESKSFSKVSEEIRLCPLRCCRRR
jgi:hypothetical protein